VAVEGRLAADGGGRAVSVSKLVAALRARLWDEFAEVWVSGEISSLHRSRLGHWYFDLVDDAATLRCVLFRGDAARAAVEPEDGMAVLARGRLDVYAERGMLQLVVDAFEPRGEGALRAAFEQLRRRLEAEGLFDPAHKQALPALPRRIGIVTSAGGAALHDFLRALRRRGAALEVVLCDARVQGDGAWREIVRALHLLDADPTIEAIVLARGGGSLEDLWAFNREELVRAVFESRAPVISAIGHEVDYVLCDFVADARAATPTAAAELVAPDARALRARVAELGGRLAGRQRARLEAARLRIEALRRALVHPAERLRGLTARVAQAGARLGAAQRRAVERRAAALGALAGKLDALSPLGVLGRGYALARRADDGRILRSASDVRAGDGVRVDLARGSLVARVLETSET
jgi:exodeoxyribonuclease VII large subunit